MHEAMRRHLNNLSRQVGGDVTDKYRFITSSDELYKSFMESKADLRYALKKETKRDSECANNKKGRKNIKLPTSSKRGNNLNKKVNKTHRNPPAMVIAKPIENKLSLAIPF